MRLKQTLGYGPGLLQLTLGVVLAKPVQCRGRAASNVYLLLDVFSQCLRTQLCQCQRHLLVAPCHGVDGEYARFSSVRAQSTHKLALA